MNEEQIEQVLLGIEDVELYEYSYPAPREEDWVMFRATFNTDFGESFISFTNLMCKYNFTGETYQITNDEKNLNESIYSVYEYECSYSTWDKNMLPIIGYGDGDCICLSIRDREFTRVYLYDHEDESFEIIGGSFEEWLGSTDGYS